jgi:hypothetical protein
MHTSGCLYGNNKQNKLQIFPVIMMIYCTQYFCTDILYRYLLLTRYYVTPCRFYCTVLWSWSPMHDQADLVLLHLRYFFQRTILLDTCTSAISVLRCIISYLSVSDFSEQHGSRLVHNLAFDRNDVNPSAMLNSRWSLVVKIKPQRTCAALWLSSYTILYSKWVLNTVRTGYKMLSD